VIERLFSMALDVAWCVGGTLSVLCILYVAVSIGVQVLRDD